jgi:hypothetical protein
MGAGTLLVFAFSGSGQHRISLIRCSRPGEVKSPVMIVIALLILTLVIVFSLRTRG